MFNVIDSKSVYRHWGSLESLTWDQCIHQNGYFRRAILQIGWGCPQQGIDKLCPSPYLISSLILSNCLNFSWAVNWIEAYGTTRAMVALFPRKRPKTPLLLYVCLRTSMTPWWKNIGENQWHTHEQPYYTSYSRNGIKYYALIWFKKWLFESECMHIMIHVIMIVQIMTHVHSLSVSNCNVAFWWCVLHVLISEYTAHCLVKH